MGALIWHEWAHFMSITAAIYSTWAGYWGCFYRKFFWDFVHGIVRTPGGIQPANQDAFFSTIIIKVPLVQLATIFTALSYIVLFYPLVPAFKKTSLYRSIVVRAVWMFVLGILCVLFYQGTNGALWSFISCGAFVRGIVKGEKMKEAKANRGKGGDA